MRPLRILALSSRVPYPVIGGDRLRVYNFLRILADRHSVDLVSLHEDKVPKDTINHLEGFLGQVSLFPHSSWHSRVNAVLNFVGRRVPLQVGYYLFPDVNRWIVRHCSQYDLVFCFHVRMTEYVMTQPVKKVVDLVDAISLNYERALQQPVHPLWRVIYTLERSRLSRYERSVISNFDRSLIISEVDKKFLVGHGAPDEKIVVVPNGTMAGDLHGSQEVAERIDILFLGNMETQANQAAVLFFVKEIYPLLTMGEDRPTFYIVGTRPGRVVRDLHDGKHVVVTGEVTDPRPYVHRARVVIAPMTFGAGVQNKILEAMGAEKPVVTTRIGAEGIEGEGGVHYLEADSPGDFAAAITRLLSNESLSKDIGRRARQLIESRYTWDHAGSILHAVVNDVMKA